MAHESACNVARFLHGFTVFIPLTTAPIHIKVFLVFLPVVGMLKGLMLNIDIEALNIEHFQF